MIKKYLTMQVALVSANYDDEGDIAIAKKELAYPINIGYDEPEALGDALASVCNSHRAFIYSELASIEGSKTEPNMAILRRLAKAQEEAELYRLDFDNEETVKGLDLLAYVIDPKTHTTYLNGKRVMRLPEGGANVINAFRDYHAGRIKFNDLKKVVLDFADGLNKIPYMKNRTMKMTDEELTELCNMYAGNSQRRRLNKRGITAQRVTKDKIIEQIILFELAKVFQFKEIVTIKAEKVVEF